MIRSVSSLELRSYEKGPMQAFQNLDVWRKAHKLTLDLYRTTEAFPRSEAFGLAAQLRRLSVDISMKITADVIIPPSLPDASVRPTVPGSSSSMCSFSAVTSI